MKGEIVVLTGASGCLGHQTLRLLISNDTSVSEIRCLDVCEPESSMRDIVNDELAKFKFKHNEEKRVVWIKGDVRDLNIVEQTLNGSHCVIHCAAKVDIWTEPSEQNAKELESIHIDGTENLLKTAIRFGVRKFIHVSSFEVYTSYDTIYYATENTLPEIKNYLFGPSASTKHQAESLIKRYSKNKLERSIKRGDDGENSMDSLNAIIIRFPVIYGEFDKHYVSEILRVTRSLGGKLQRVDNIWIRQQPIYVGNAAWALICSKQRMNIDQSISGEEFHITDETTIGDPFDFVEPFLECKNMHVTKNSYPFLLIWLSLLLLASLKRLIRAIDFLGLFTRKRSRLQEAIDQDKKTTSVSSDGDDPVMRQPKAWHQIITPQTLGFMCISGFLNRTKASLRLDYNPLYDPDESRRRSLDWYKNHLKL